MTCTPRGLISSARSLSLAALFAAPVVASDAVVVSGQSIQAAIDNASDGDRILVHEGLYYEALDFRGKRLEVIALAGAEYTLLDATSVAAPAVRVASGETLGTTLYGFTIRGGFGEQRSDLNTPLCSGAGVLVAESSHLLIERCVIAGNGHSTADLGGGLYVHGAGTVVDVVNCVVHSNGARHGGGGVAVVGGAHAQIESSTVFNNYAAVGTGGVSGIITGSGATTDIHEAIVWGNEGIDLGSSGWLGTGTITVSYSDVGGFWSGVLWFQSMKSMHFLLFSMFV